MSSHSEDHKCKIDKGEEDYRQRKAIFRDRNVQRIFSKTKKSLWFPHSIYGYAKEK
jgi:catabolite regulation protein CreA